MGQGLPANRGRAGLHDPLADDGVIDALDHDRGHAKPLQFQQQLRNLNAIEFGYQAPTAGQYLEGERQLAALGKARGPNAPEPIRVASAASLVEDANPIQAMVSPLTGKAMAAEVKVTDVRDASERATTPAKLSARLTQLDRAEVRAE